MGRVQGQSPAGVVAFGCSWRLGVFFKKIIRSTWSMTTQHQLPLNHLFYVYPVINEVVVLMKIVEKNRML